MLEGNPPRHTEASPLDEELEGAVLRELTWAELRSRLAASRGIRRPFGDDEGVEASFDAGSARRIAAQHNGKEFLNPDALAHGKEPAGTGNGVTLAPPMPRGSE
jgi:hypothetical protein